MTVGTIRSDIARHPVLCRAAVAEKHGSNRHTIDRAARGRDFRVSALPALLSLVSECQERAGVSGPAHVDLVIDGKAVSAIATEDLFQLFRLAGLAVPAGPETLNGRN